MSYQEATRICSEIQADSDIQAEKKAWEIGKLHLLFNQIDKLLW